MITFSAWPSLPQVELTLHLRHASAKERGRHIVATKVTRAQSVLRSFDTPIEAEHEEADEARAHEEAEAPEPEPRATPTPEQGTPPKNAPAAEPLTPVVKKPEPQERVGTDKSGDARYKPRRRRSEYHGRTSRLEANVGMTIGGEGASSPPGDRPSPPR